MKKTLYITCTRANGDDVEAKLLELDNNAKIDVTDAPKMVGLVEGLSIAASISTVAASSFVIWSEIEKRKGNRIEVEEQTENGSRDEIEEPRS